MPRLLSSLTRLAFALSVFGLCSVLGEQKAAANVDITPHQEVLQQNLLADGIYKVMFSSPDGKNGTGIVVISESVVNGGDSAYTYQGFFELTGSELKSNIEVVRYNPGDSIFGPLDNFQLELNGKIEEGGKAFTASGTVKFRPELRIKLTGNWVSGICKIVSSNRILLNSVHE